VTSAKPPRPTPSSKILRSALSPGTGATTVTPQQRRAKTPAPERQAADTDALNAMVRHVHLYWVQTFGEHPRPEDSMVIVGVLAAMEEYYTLTPRPSTAP